MVKHYSEFIAQKFYKSESKQLPPNEQINYKFSTQLLSGHLSCTGKLYLGTQAFYFYSKVNYKTFLGKSTKLRLLYKDCLKVEHVKQGLLVTPTAEMDLRSKGLSGQPSTFLFAGFQKHEAA